ncbi:MAG: hypothetical protein ACRC8Q_06455 [Aeromonas sp.]
MNPVYFINRAINVQAVIDHTAVALSTADYVNARSDGMIFESATLEEIEATYLYGLDTNEQMITEAIKSTRNRIDRTMAAFVSALNQQLNPAGIDAAAPVIGSPKKSGQVAIMTAQIPLSDGQAIFVIFHSPSGTLGKIEANDDLLAFRFLLNKRDVTHVVAPSGGRDISLKQTCLTLSNLAERNSDKFQKRQADIKTKEAELETIQADTAAALAEVADIVAKADQLSEKQADDSKKEAEIKRRLAKQIATNDELRRQLEGFGGRAEPSPTATPTPEPTPAGQGTSALPTDTIRKVNLDLKTNGESTLSNGAKISTLVREESGSLEGYIKLIEPSGKSYVLKSKTSQGGAMEDAGKALYKAYRDGKADKYLGTVLALPGAATDPALPQQDDPSALIEPSPEVDVRAEAWAKKLDDMTSQQFDALFAAAGLKRRLGTSSAKALRSLSPDDLDAADAIAKTGEMTNAADAFWYGLRARPLSVGALPQGIISYVESEKAATNPIIAARVAAAGGNSVRHGAVAYDRQLTPEEVAQYELVDLSSAPAFSWDEQSRASKFAELSSLTKAMLQAGDEPSDIWQQVMKPKSPQINKNPFFVDGKYATTEITKAFQEAGYSGTVTNMFNQFAEKQWNELEQDNKTPEDLEAELKENARQKAIAALSALIKGAKKPAGWAMSIDMEFGDGAAISIDTPVLPNGEEHEGYLVTANENAANELDGTFNLLFGHGEPISKGHTTWAEISKSMQADYKRDAGNVAVEPTGEPEARQENQWGEQDPQILALLQEAEALRSAESNSRRYLTELQRISAELDRLGAIERHEPYLHTVSDRLTELMEAEGI